MKLALTKTQTVRYAAMAGIIIGLDCVCIIIDEVRIERLRVYQAKRETISCNSLVSTTAKNLFGILRAYIFSILYTIQQLVA